MGEKLGACWEVKNKVTSSYRYISANTLLPREIISF
jgi:hypothetical protein